MRADKRPQPCDVTVYSDKGSLALRFPKRHNPLWEQLDGKPLNGKPKCLGIGKYGYKDNPEDWKRATQLAIALEADLDHSEWEKLFDPTLAKYGIGSAKYAKLAEVLQLPGIKQPEPEITVGEMWEDYLLWKETQVEPTTFSKSYRRTYTNIIKGLRWNKKTRKYENTELGIWDVAIGRECAEKLTLCSSFKKDVISCIQALNEAFTRASQIGKLNLPDVNPFFELHKKMGSNPKQKYQSTVGADGETIEWWISQDAKNLDDQENDRRAFTKEERDIVIRAFYNSEKAKESRAASLTEFLFLTGCRPGEAFALRWGDVMFDRGIIRFSKSYASEQKITKRTKTKEVRMFPLGDKRLIDLLINLQPFDFKSTDLVFKQSENKPWNTNQYNAIWLGQSTKYGNKTYYYPGVVTRLVEKGEIKQYFSPYHTRHTFITLTAHANKDNTSALLLLAHSCGNSPEVIMKHYLDVDREVQLTFV